MSRLVKLPSGDWIDPRQVFAIEYRTVPARPFAGPGDQLPQLVVWFSKRPSNARWEKSAGRDYHYLLVRFDSVDEAKAYQDVLAEAVNVAKEVDQQRRSGGVAPVRGAPNRNLRCVDLRTPAETVEAEV